MSITTVTPDELAQGIVLRKTMETLLKVTAERDALSDALSYPSMQALKADAERWRYLRQKGANWFDIADAANELDGGVDEAVDLAMKGKS